jgi:hypothetical protein
MSINVRDLSVSHVIVHQVPKRDRSVDADEAITFSDTPIPGLQATKQNFFVERINASLIERAYSIVPLAGHVSTMPSLVHGLIGDPSLLVPNSKDMARALYNAQGVVSNPGLLAVILGQLLAEPCVAVLKLEYRDGMQIKPITTATGEQTFSADILDDLTLTEDGRVFKASVFRSRTDQPDGLEGLASDDQRRAGSGKALSDFFLNTFLGCTFATAPDRQTQEFYDAAVSFFDTLPDPEHRIEYRRALVATMISPALTLSAAEFSEQFLRDEHKAAFDATFEDRKVSMTAFDKDTRLIESQLKRTRLRTVHGITLSGTPDVMAELVTVEPGTDGRPGRIVIGDTITKITS